MPPPSVGLEAVCFGLSLGALSLEFEPGTNRHLLLEVLFQNKQKRNQTLNHLTQVYLENGSFHSQL